MKATWIPAETYDEALAYVAACLFKPGRVIVLQIAHDDCCKAIRTKRDADCRPPCKPDFYAIEPVEVQP